MQRTILKTAVIKQKNSRFCEQKLQGTALLRRPFCVNIIPEENTMLLGYQQNSKLLRCHISSEDTYHIVYLTLPSSVCERNQKAKAGIENKIR